MFVRDWMQKEIVTLSPGETLGAAKAVMEERRIRRIPVVDDEKRLLGIISQEDIKKALPSEVDVTTDQTARALANQIEIATFMTPDPITVAPNDPIESVAARMKKNKIGGIPVVEEGKLVGIITESDIFAALVEVLGGTNRDTRIELTIGRETDAIYKVFEALSMYGVPLNNVAICNNYSSQSRAVIIRITGNQTQEAIDALWEAGCKITSIIHQK